ncbi:NAD(P)-dependent oxidoreductase [Candidatus Poribacteria bacterium]|nr:NAD(P)-dependent oxidoreductase [Candidatus Poribacteria bacterium]
MGKKCVFVNGGSGFIGCFISIGLAARGCRVIVIDKMEQLAQMRESLYEEFIKARLALLKKHDVNIVTMDIENSDKYIKLIEEYDPSCIYCMNAVTNVKFCNVNPSIAITENIARVENILDYIRKTNPNIRIVFASSSSAYGNFTKDKMGESEPLKPVNIYGFSKRASEELIQLYNRIYGIPYTIIRPSAPYGPLRVNQTITQIIIERALRNETIQVNGDGEARLDFTCVSDTAEGFVLAGVEETGRNEIFNIACGEARSINDLLRITRKYFPTLKVEYKEQDKTAAERGTLDIAKAKQLLKYAPQFPLETGYPKYIEWYLNKDYTKID